MGYHLLAGISAVGLLASVGCHLMGWMQKVPPWGKSTFWLHIGIFLVWFPLVTLANRTMPDRERGNLEHLLKELPGWARSLGTALFAYALLNFMFFIFSSQQYPRNKVPFLVELRGFSGHWMMFYGFAVAGFVALGRLARKRNKQRGG